MILGKGSAKTYGRLLSSRTERDFRVVRASAEREVKRESASSKITRVNMLTTHSRL